MKQDNKQGQGGEKTIRPDLNANQESIRLARVGAGDGGGSGTERERGS